MRRRFCVFGILILLFVAASATGVFATSYTSAYKSKKRYVVTCNHHYDNKYNTLAKYDSVSAAKSKIKEQKASYRGQWYVWDSRANKIVWPDLSTKKKKVDKIVAWVTAVGNDPRHGYDTDGELTSKGCDLSCKRWGKCGDYGCSTLVATPFELFDFANLRSYAKKHKLKYRVSDGRGPYTGLNANNFAQAVKGTKGFTDLSSSFAKKGIKMLKPGDIVVNSNQSHVAIISTDDRIVEGNLNENGKEFSQSKPGDQRGGQELAVSKYTGGYRFYKGIKYVFRPKT